MTRRVRPAHDAPAPDYPTREQRPDEWGCNEGRRRFLKQLAAGSGAVAVGLPRLVHGQSLPVSFDRLDRHPLPVSPPVMADEAFSEPAGDAASADFDDEAEPAPEASEAEADDQADAAPEITENRALWVDPGYLILLRWRRPLGNEAPVAALEGSADLVRTHLDAQVTSVDQIHNIEQLHALEGALLVLLQGAVAPATLEVIHLDHDCRVVCSALDPSRGYPEIIEVGIGRSSTPRDLPATPRISNPSRFFTPSERRGPYPTRFTRGPAESSALVPSVVVTSTRPRTTLRWVGLGTAG